MFGLRSIDEHRNLQCSPHEKKVDDRGKVYLEYTNYGSKTNCGLKHMNLENQTIRQYENPADKEHCVVNIFVKYLCFVPSRDKHFYFRALADDGSGVPRFTDQPVGRNNWGLFDKCGVHSTNVPSS